MKKFRVTVIREDEYEVEFDENIFDKDFMEHFKEYFYDFDSLEEHAAHIAQFRARFGERFIEGYGLPRVDGKLPFAARVDKENIKSVNQGLNINIISEDDLDRMDTEVEEV